MDTNQEWGKIKELFGAALERDPSERAAFLQAACGTNVALRQEVESLIEAHTSSNLWQHPLRPQPPENTEGRFIGPYQLLKLIGEGGMGQVWLAQQTAPLQRQVSLRLIRCGMYDDTLLHRFQAERQRRELPNGRCGRWTVPSLVAWMPRKPGTAGGQNWGGLGPSSQSPHPLADREKGGGIRIGF